MALQLSTAARNATLDAIEATIGATPTLELRTGSPPANAAAADSGTLLATLTLPADWMAAASGGTKAKAGTWAGTGAAAGTAAHFRIKQGSTCHAQGTVTATGGGGDMELGDLAVTVGKIIAVATFTLTAPNA